MTHNAPQLQATKTPARYRSAFERRIAQALEEAGAAFYYEPPPIKYRRYRSGHLYRPDFLLWNGIMIEAKGRFTDEDQAKHLYIRMQHPGIDIRFVFLNASQPLQRGSLQTYADWCRMCHFQFAEKAVPLEWLR